MGALDKDQKHLQKHEEESSSVSTDNTHLCTSLDETDECSQPNGVSGSNAPLTQQWADIGLSHNFEVRGPKYPKNRRKLLSGPTIGRLVHFDLIECSERTTRVDNIASIGACARRVKELQSLAGGQLSSLSDTQDGEDPFLFILALQVPGTPMVYAVLYWAIDPELLSGDSTDPAVRLLQTYVDLPIKEKPYIAKKMTKSLSHFRMTLSPKKLPEKRTRSPQKPAPHDHSSPHDNLNDEGSESLEFNSFHASRFKIVPRVVKGPWVIKKGVGAVPCLLGQKVSIRVFRGKGYCETNVDMRNPIARSVLSNCRGCSTKLEVMLAVLIQGDTEEELPERLLGCVQFSHLKIEESDALMPLLP